MVKEGKDAPTSRKKKSQLEEESESEDLKEGSEKKADISAKSASEGGSASKKESAKKRSKKEEIEEEEMEDKVVEVPRNMEVIGRPLPPSLKETATMLKGSSKGAPNQNAGIATAEKSAKKEKVPIDPSQVHVHEIEIPEELKQYQRGCLLRIRKVGNSRFSQEMTRAANQLFIKKLGRGQYFVPDYYLLNEIQAWAKKWDTTLEYIPIDESIRQVHMQDVRSKISATGEDLTKKVKELDRSLKMRDDQLIKIQMTSDEEKGNLLAEIENLHTQLDDSERKIDELQTKIDDADMGTGAAKIGQLEQEIESLKEERDGNERLYREVQAKLSAAQAEIDSLREQLSAAGKSPKAVAAVAPEPKETKSTKASKPSSPAPKVKPEKGKKKIVEQEIPEEDAAELDGIADLLTAPEQSVEKVEEEEPVNEEELQKALAYKKPKWDDNDAGVEVNEGENVEMSDEELEEYEREQKKRESGGAEPEDSDEE